MPLGATCKVVVVLLPFMHTFCILVIVETHNARVQSLLHPFTIVLPVLASIKHELKLKYFILGFRVFGDSLLNYVAYCQSIACFLVALDHCLYD